MSSIHIEQNGVTRTLSGSGGRDAAVRFAARGLFHPRRLRRKRRCGKCRVPDQRCTGASACRVYPADGDTVTLPESAGGAILTRTLPLPACQPGRTGLRRRRRPRHDDRRRAAV